MDDYLLSRGGSLHVLSYATHESFYHLYCELDEINVSEVRKKHPSTKRAYEAILQNSSPADQAKIIRGTIRFVKERVLVRRSERDAVEPKLLTIVSRLEVGGHVPSPHLPATTETVRIALDNAQLLLDQRGPVEAMDRAYVALHGHIKKICEDQSVTFTKRDPDIMEIFSALRQQCPEMKAAAHDDHAKKLFRALGAALDSLNFIRNRGTLSHANEMLLEKSEAALFINLSRAVLQYLDSKLSRKK